VGRLGALAALDTGSGDAVALARTEGVGVAVDAGPGLDAPAWLARAAISFREPRLRSEDRAGDTVLGATLAGIGSGFGAVGSDSWDIFFSPAEANDA